MEVCKALRHVYNTLDTENQWKRAVKELKKMNDLERAKAWQLFSADTFEMESNKEIVLSQYKRLFKHALLEASKQTTVDKEDTEVYYADILDTLRKY